MIRTFALTVALMACTQPDRPVTSCVTNAPCGADDACAADGECMPPSEMRKVQLSWTIALQPPDPSNCAASPAFEVDFQTAPLPGEGDVLTFAPVPCIEGKFTIGNLPARYWIAGAKTSATGNSAGMAVPIDETGSAAIDLPY